MVVARAEVLSSARTVGVVAGTGGGDSASGAAGVGAGGGGGGRDGGSGVWQHGVAASDAALALRSLAMPAI